jgi:CRP-like cAMP-binding protein/CheY-like chemotaxis protein
MKKILLIEDNIEMRENTAEILSLGNYEVYVAENGKIGVEKARSIIPDLIICDVMMPELDGYSVLHMLSKDPKTSAIPFIFLTAKADKSDIRKGMNMGADDYITKPFTESELLNAIETRINRNLNIKKSFDKTEKGLFAFINAAKGYEELKNISADKKSKKYKKKEIIYREGDNPYYLFFISKGKVKTYRTHEDGKEFIVGLYNEGDFIGYLPLLDESVYNETAEAIEPCELHLIPKSDFNSLLTANRDVSAQFIKILTNEVLEKEERLIKTAYSSVRKRVAGALLELNKRYNTDKKNSFSIAISRDDLAQLVGTATETVIRTLSDFKDEGLIESKGSNITLLDVKKLNALRF